MSIRFLLPQQNSVPDTVNVKDFGAIGDGITDDLAAFKAALAAGSHVYIPEGNYLLDGYLPINTIKVIRGASQSKTTLTFPAGYGILIERQLPSEPDYSELSNFTVQGSFNYYSVADGYWKPNHAYNVGDVVVNTLPYGGFTQLVNYCTVAGTSGGTEPSWPVRNDPDGYDLAITASNLPTTIDGTVQWKSYSAPGIMVRSPAYIHNVGVFSFPGDGIFVSGTDNANVSRIADANIQGNLGRGVYVHGGGNSQVCQITGITSQGNFSGGFCDNSQVGNTYISNVSESNGVNFWQANAGAVQYAIIPGYTAIPSNSWIDLNAVNSIAPLLQITAGFAGTTGGSEPAWTTNIGDTFVDGTVTWKVVGLCTTGHCYKTRGDGLDRCLFIGNYIENDQRLGELGFAFWLGNIGNLFTHNSSHIFLEPDRLYSALQWFTRPGQVVHPLNAFIGSRDNVQHEVFGWGQGNQNTADTYEYRLTLDGDGYHWSLSSGGNPTFKLSTHTASEGEGVLTFWDNLSIRNADDGAVNYENPWKLKIANTDYGSGPLSTEGKLGDWYIDRAKNYGVAQMWICNSPAPSSVWKEVNLDTNRFIYAAASDYTITTSPGAFITYRGTVFTDNVYSAPTTTPLSYILPDVSAQPVPTNLKYYFWTQLANTDGYARMKVVAHAGQKIRIGDNITTSGGYISVDTIGAWLCLESTGYGLADAAWIATEVVGNWQTDSSTNNGANKSDLHLTTTSATTAAIFTPSTQGNYMVNVYYRVVTATTNVTITLTWTDGSGAQTSNIVPLTSAVVGSYSTAPTYINSIASTITVTATAGTANNVYVSATIGAV